MRYWPRRQHNPDRIKGTIHMTIARSLRSLAAAALAAGLVLPAAASAAGGPGKHGGPGGQGGGSHASVPGPGYHVDIRRHKVSGTLTWMSGTTVPATLTVQAGSTVITVTV